MNTYQALEFQSDRIEAVLQVNKVPARVTGGTVTPRWIRFCVVPALGTKPSAIRSLSETLAAALDASSCRVSRRGAVVNIEIPRDDPQPVRLLPLYHQLTEPHLHSGRIVQPNIAPVTAILGLAEDGAPLLIRLPSPDVAHILVAGTTGSGKTVLLQTMILSLAMVNPVKKLNLVLVDPKGHAFSLFEGLPHLIRHATGTQEITETLVSLTRVMDWRNEHQQATPHQSIVLVIDELADLLMVGSKKAQWALTRLTQRGRQAGIHVVAATQKPTAAILGPLVKANFPVRLVGKVTSIEDARVAAGWSGTGAERLLGRGDFLAIAEGRVIHFQAAHVTEEEICQTVAKLPGAKPSARPAKPPVSPARVIVLPRAEPTPDTALAQKLLQSDFLWNSRKHPSRNGYRWGFKSRACRLLFPGQPLAGTWAIKTTRIIALAEQITTVEE